MSTRTGPSYSFCGLDRLFCSDSVACQNHSIVVRSNTATSFREPLGHSTCPNSYAVLAEVPFPLAAQYDQSSPRNRQTMWRVLTSLVLPSTSFVFFLFFFFFIFMAVHERSSSPNSMTHLSISFFFILLPIFNFSLDCKEPSILLALFITKKSLIIFATYEICCTFSMHETQF